MIAGQAVIAVQAVEGAEATRFLELADRQGSLVQTIALQARELADASTPNRVRAASELRRSLDEWKQAHHALLNGSDQLRLPAAPNRLRGILARQEPDAVSVIDAGEQIQADWPRLSARAAGELVGQIGSHFEAVQANAQQLSQTYQVGKAAQAQTFQRSEVLLLLLTLTLLAAQAIFVIRPASKRLQGLIQDLTVAHREIGDQNALLARNAQVLELRKRELETANDSLERLNHDLELVSEQHRVAARRFQDLFRDIPVACYTFDQNGAVFEWNAAAGALWGRGSWETFQLNCFETLYSEEEGNFLRILSNRVFEGGSVHGLETRALTLSGEQRIVVSHMIPLRNSAGEVTGALNASIDITEQRVPKDAFHEPAEGGKAVRKRAA